MLKDAVSMPGISMTCVLNKALKMKCLGDSPAGASQKGCPNLYAPGQPCNYKCNEGCIVRGCGDCKQVRTDCKICPKNKPYELLKTRMVGGPTIIFSRYLEVGVSQIRFHKYRNPKTCASIIGFSANSLYVYCSGQEMLCGKEEYVEVENPQDSSVIKDLCDKVLMGELFDFLQVDIQVPDALLEKFNEFSPLFIIDSIPENQIPQHMKDYQERTGRSAIRGTKKLLGVTKATEILLYTLMLKWYLSHGLTVTAIHKYLKYVARRPFS